MKQLPEVNQDITCFALDMDGTVYLGTKWIEGAVDFLKAVEKAGKQYIFLTNNSSKGPENYVEKLAAMGLIVTKDRIVTSGQATISYLKKHYPGKRVYLLGPMKSFAGSVIMSGQGFLILQPIQITIVLLRMALSRISALFMN